MSLFIVTSPHSIPAFKHKEHEGFTMYTKILRTQRANTCAICKESDHATHGKFLTTKAQRHEGSILIQHLLSLNKILPSGQNEVVPATSSIQH